MTLGRVPRKIRHDGEIRLGRPMDVAANLPNTGTHGSKNAKHPILSRKRPRRRVVFPFVAFRGSVRLVLEAFIGASD